MQALIRRILLVFFLLLLFAIRPAYSTHIVGGEIFYTQLSSDQYEITMKLYRDCYNGVPDFDDPAYVFIYNTQGTLVLTLPMDYTGKVLLPIILTSPCLTPPANVCVEEAVYKEIVTLPPIAGGYDIVYQRCCRNQTILNIIDPGDAGSSYYAHIPGMEVTTQNSSPSFNNFPPLFLCTNTPIEFDHAATDPDGDSLVYEFCAPYTGATPDCPIRGPGMGFGCPTNSPPPPYDEVQYNPGYSASAPFNASPALSLDATGYLTGTPIQIGQYVVGVCVYEYRNGVLLSVNKRDFQFNILSCSNAIASIPEQTVFCDGYKVEFGNSSANSTSYFWDFGDTTTTADTSIDQTPSYIYPDSGTYTIMLIAYNQSINCVDTAYSTFKVYPLLDPDFSVGDPECLSNNKYLFNASGDFTQDATFQWSFPDATPVMVTGPSATDIVFNEIGSLSVTLTASQYGCTKSITKQVEILPGPLAKITPQSDPCVGKTIEFGNESEYSVNYHWDFGVPIQETDTSNLFNPSYTYSDTGTYTIMLIASDTSTSCVDTAYAIYKALPLLEPEIPLIPDQCFSGHNFSFSPSGTFTDDAEFFWDFGSDATIPYSADKQVTGVGYPEPGSYDIILTVSQYGCEEDVAQQITIVEDPKAEITGQTEFCEGFTVDFKNSSQFTTMYYWDFGVGETITDTSFAFEPTYTFPDSGKYTVTLVAYNDLGCASTDSKTFFVYPLVTAGSSPQNPQCITGNSFDFNIQGTFSQNADIKWIFDEHASIDSSTMYNPSDVTFDTSGVFYFSVQVSEYGCNKKFIDSLKVYARPKSGFSILDSVGCHPVTVRFQDTVFSETPVTYRWSFGDGAIADTADPVHIYESPGVYDVTLVTYSSAGCTDTLTILKEDAVIVYDYPLAGINVTPETASEFDPVFEFSDESTGATSCLIRFGDGETSDECNIAHTYPDTGIFRYTQVVTNEGGCMDSISGTIEVTPEYRFFIPNAFTPNGDGKNDFFFPSFMGVVEAELLIFNRWGELIFHSTDNNPSWDGRYKGEVCQQEVYNYILHHKNVFNKRFTHRGMVTLLK